MKQKEPNFIPTRIVILSTTVSAVIWICCILAAIVQSILRSDHIFNNTALIVIALLVIVFNVLFMIHLKSIKNADRYKRWLSIPILLLMAYYALMTAATMYSNVTNPIYGWNGDTWHLITAYGIMYLPLVSLVAVLAILAAVMLISPRRKAPWVSLLALLCAVSRFSQLMASVGTHVLYMEIEGLDVIDAGTYIMQSITGILVLTELTLLLVPAKTVSNPLPVEEDDPDSPAITGGSEV